MTDFGHKRTDICAILSFISGLIAIALIFLGIGCCFTWLLGIPLAVTAVVLGFVSLSRLKQNPDTLAGRGLAIAGLIMGVVGLILPVGLFMLGIVAAAADSGGNVPPIKF